MNYIVDKNGQVWIGELWAGAKWYATSVNAIDPTSGIMRFFHGPNVPGISFDDAWQFCEINQMKFLKVEGEIVADLYGTNYDDRVN